MDVVINNAGVYGNKVDIRTVTGEHATSCPHLIQLNLLCGHWAPWVSAVPAIPALVRSKQGEGIGAGAGPAAVSTPTGLAALHNRSV